MPIRRHGIIVIVLIVVMVVVLEYIVRLNNVVKRKVVIRWKEHDTDKLREVN